MAELLKKSSFDPHLNDKFKIHTESVGVVEVELVEITEKNTEKVECFSLIFKGPKDKEFEQNTHKVDHVKMGKFDLFIVPIISEKQDGIYYQAIFNRLIKK
jgi:hypothetical protein